MDALTLESLIESGATVATKMVSGGANFIGALYSANPIGQFIVVAGIASTVIGVGTKLFLRKKNV